MRTRPTVPQGGKMNKLLLALVVTSQVALASVSMANTSDIEVNAETATEEQAQTTDGRIGFGIYIGPSFGGYYGPAYRDAVCEARNRRGEYFRARGYNIRDAERNALNKCYRYSRHCWIVRCHR